MSYEWLAYFLGVSYEGYNWWRKTKKTGDAYKKSTMEDIMKSWEENASKFGAFLLLKTKSLNKMLWCKENKEENGIKYISILNSDSD
ncbi:MAG: hypothetical protein KAG14_00915 [Mycoplasmataceae bacterium]|nr:hypothetical protein [Mycoplasmataceae bacterium]